jgi:hypothetical protein
METDGPTEAWAPRSAPPKRVRDLKVAILQIPKKCAEICAYQLRKEDSAARVRKKIAHGVR